MKIVDGPFRQAELARIPILDLFTQNVEAGELSLRSLVEVAREKISNTEGPVLYFLSGPEPSKATPMQYGGLFLEIDRELLLEAKRVGHEVWLFVDCGPGAYLDFVSDLPADVFAWDAKKTGFPLSEMRQLRCGLLCTNEEGADVSWEEFARQAEQARPGQSAKQASRTPQEQAAPKGALVG